MNRQTQSRRNKGNKKYNKSIVSQISKVYEIRGESMVISEQTIKSWNKRLIILKRELEPVQKSRTLERRVAAYVEMLQSRQQECMMILIQPCRIIKRESNITSANTIAKKQKPCKCKKTKIIKI